MKRTRHGYSQEEQIVKFQMTVETMRKQVDSYAEAIVAFCEQNEVDELDVLHLISPALEEKIRKECVLAGLLKEEMTQIEF